MDDVGMVIVGAGEAGARTASALREHGFAGPVTLVGDEPHGPYERPPLSKAVMTADGSSPPTILDEARLAAQSILHLAGVRATRIDRAGRRVVLDDGRKLPYAKLLIATGAGPRRLPVPGANTGNVLYLRTFADALVMRETLRPGARLVVIGGGFIGLEIAASAIQRGCSVVLIEAAPRILMRGVPREVADRVMARHARAGVSFHLGSGLDRIERHGERLSVVLADETSVGCDVIVAGIGAIPETALAEASGLRTENGVRVDEHLRTDDPDIFAAGDCCSFPHPLFGGRRLRLEAWRSAQDQGTVAARNMLGHGVVFDAVPWFWSDQYDETLQVAGLADEGTAMVERDLGAGRLYFHLDGTGRLVGVSGVGPNAVIAKDVRIAEMMIARRAVPDPTALAKPKVKLKGLLR